jgi:hypothetical protein
MDEKRRIHPLKVCADFCMNLLANFFTAWRAILGAILGEEVGRLKKLSTSRSNCLGFWANPEGENFHLPDGALLVTMHASFF